MRLKVLTTTAFVFGLLCLLLWPLLLGPRPGPGASRQDLARYGLRFLTYYGVTSAAFVATAVFAVLLARQTRREYLERTRENLQDLIEGTLRDHGRKDA